MSQHKTRQINRIVTATLTLIDTEGLSQLSMSAVATAAGLTRQTLYNYFPDIESILASVMDAHSAEVQKHLLGVMDSAIGTRAKLRAFAEFQISVAASGHGKIDLHAALSPAMRAKLEAHAGPVKAALQDVIETAITTKELTMAIEPRIACDLAWRLVEGAASTAEKHPDNQVPLLDAVDRAIWAALQG